MSTVAITPAVFVSRAGDSPHRLAACYRQAAALIRLNTYDPCTAFGPYEGQHGTSVCGALRHVAATMCPDNPADAADLADELETRLAAVLYLTGQLTRRTSIQDITDLVAGWEDCRPGAGWRTQPEVLAVLETAAALLGTIGGAV